MVSMEEELVWQQLEIVVVPIAEATIVVIGWRRIISMSLVLRLAKHYLLTLV